MTARFLLAIMENFQDEGGTYVVPEVLERYGAPRTPAGCGGLGLHSAAGGVPERSKGAVLKTAEPLNKAPWVRIPPPPLTRRNPALTRGLRGTPPALGCPWSSPFVRCFRVGLATDWRRWRRRAAFGALPSMTTKCP